MSHLMGEPEEHQIRHQLFSQARRYVNFLTEVTLMAQSTINGMMLVRIKHLEYQQDIVVKILII